MVFLLLAYGVSWAGGLVWANALSPWVASRGFFARAYVSSLVVVLGPALAALLVTWIADGASATHTLVRQLRPRRDLGGWYVSLPIVGIVVSGLAYVAAGVPLGVLGAAMSGGNSWWLAAHFTVQVVMVGFGEELGWRGWLLPHLARTHRFGVATLLTILVWELWHLPKLAAGFTVGATLVVQVAAAGVIFSWLWVRVSGNVFALAIAHASMNAPVFFVEHVADVPAAQQLAGWRNMALVYAAMAVIAGVRSRRLWQQTGQPRLPFA